MEVTKRECKHTIDPPIPYVIEVCGKFVDNTVNEEEVSLIVVPILRPPPPFPSILVKKSEDDKYG